MGSVENSWESIEAALRPLVQDEEGAKEVASSFYDVAWVPIRSSFRTYEEAHGQEGAFLLSWRNVGGMVAGLRGRGESYLDWCWEAESQDISARVRAIMESLGLRPVR